MYFPQVGILDTHTHTHTHTHTETETETETETQTRHYRNSSSPPKALVLDTRFRSKEDRAQSFGLWGIAGFIGSCLGPLVTGGVLWIFPGVGLSVSEKNNLGCLGRFFLRGR